MWVETFTGLRIEQFGRLRKALRERGGEGCAWRFPLAERVLLVAVCYRTDPHRAAARAAVRHIVGHRVPGDPAHRPAARARACRAPQDSIHISIHIGSDAGMIPFSRFPSRPSRMPELSPASPFGLGRQVTGVQLS
jgi:hypothetical protein